MIYFSDFASVAGPVTATYWRLRFPDGSFGTNFVSIAEVEMRATEGGADQCTGGTATSSSDAGSSFAASKAFDNDATTTFATASGSHVNSWLKYQFASPVSVVEVSLRTGSGTDISNEMPSSFVVEYSNDNSAWTTAWTETRTYGWIQGETKVFKQSAAYTEAGPRFWRFLFTDGSGGSFLALTQAELRATSGGADVTNTTLNVASASTVFSLPASTAFDNTLDSNEWATTSGNAVNSWLKAKLTAGTPVLEVMMRSCSHSGERPRATSVQYSYDNVNWSTEWSFTAGFTSNLETKIYTKP